MNAVTSLSRSGPSIISYFAEAIIEAGIKTGLSQGLAKELYIQTLARILILIQTGLIPQRLSEMGTLPGVINQAGLNFLNSMDFKSHIVDTILASKKG